MMASRLPGRDQQLDMNEMSLRGHLLAAQAAAAGQVPTHVPGPINSHHSTPQPDQRTRLPPLGSTSPHGRNIDPAIGGLSHAMTPEDRMALVDTGSGDEDGSPGGKKKGANRELSTTKRAAQNRAAQRAFRQRKEGYIKKLEEEVRNMQALEESYKHIQHENYQLRDYVINLQSRLLESQGEYPQPPPAIQLRDPRSSDPNEMQHQPHVPTASMGSSAISQLQQAAVAAAQAGSLAEDVRYQSRMQDESQMEIYQEPALPYTRTQTGMPSATVGLGKNLLSAPGGPPASFEASAARAVSDAQERPNVPDVVGLQHQQPIGT